MSSEGSGGGSAGVFIGAGIGGCALIVGVIAIAIYCYMKARKEKSHTNMTKSHDVFSTAASNTQLDYPRRSRVNQFPDPEAARRKKERSRRRDKEQDQGHVNAAYTRHGSDSSSIGSDIDGRDLSPPRVRRPRGGQVNEAFSSESSYEDSSSIDDDPIGGSYTMERETNDRRRSSYKRSKQTDLIDGGNESQRTSRRDDFSKRNLRSDSPLTIATLSKHEKITRQETDQRDDKNSRNNKSKRRDSSPTRTYESSDATGTSLVTEGTEFTATTVSSGQRYNKNDRLRRNSPSRSSSHRRYRKDGERDSEGHRKPRRTHSSDRQKHSDRSRSPGGSQRSGSQRSGSSRRSRSSTASEAKRANKEQAILPIFAKAGDKKSSAV